MDLEGWIKYSFCRPEDPQAFYGDIYENTPSSHAHQTDYKNTEDTNKQDEYEYFDDDIADMNGDEDVTEDGMMIVPPFINENDDENEEENDILNVSEDCGYTDDMGHEAFGDDENDDDEDGLLADDEKGLNKTKKKRKTPGGCKGTAIKSSNKPNQKKKTGTAPQTTNKAKLNDEINPKPKPKPRQKKQYKSKSSQNPMEKLLKDHIPISVAAPKPHVVDGEQTSQLTDKTNTKSNPNPNTKSRTKRQKVTNDDNGNDDPQSTPLKRKRSTKKT